ncbi:MAG: hypothetical protein ACK42C_06000 [Aquificaceae bacterium]|uniref:hypothetical protein n=1 Tax=Hydrogenobacter sp. Uz 6-8 TaxID=3384828 RepID=UPI00309C2E85
MKYFLAASLLLLLNFLYSAYSIDVARDYARKVSELKREKEKSLTIKAEIEKYVNYRTVKSYAESAGFSPVDWNRVKVVRSSVQE